MSTVVTDIDTQRPNDGEHYTVYFRQGNLASNMLIPQEAVDGRGIDLIKLAQVYLDTHRREVPFLKKQPALEEAGPVTKYLIDRSLEAASGMISVGRNPDEAASMVANLHERDESIQSFDDVIKSLQEDMKKFPTLRDCIEYHPQDEYCPAGEPLIQTYTNLASYFATTLDAKRDRLIYIDTIDFPEDNFQKLREYMMGCVEGNMLAEIGTFGSVYAGDVCIDIDACYDRQNDLTDIEFTCYMPADKETAKSYSEPVKGYAFESTHTDFCLRDDINVEKCVSENSYTLFIDQLRDCLEKYVQPRLEKAWQTQEVDALVSKNRFWQCMKAKERWPNYTVMPSPTSFNRANPAQDYDGVELIPPGFHDETDPRMDSYPVIADNENLLYIEEDYWQKQAADENASFRLVLKDGEMDCRAVADIANSCPVQGALMASNQFSEVLGKVKELLPKMREARERLDAMYETAVTIRTASSNMSNQFMQVYWSAYNGSNMTDKDDHEAACCKAIRCCMDRGAKQGEILKIVDAKAPMAVWEKDGKYAVRTVGEVNREREAEKTNSAGASR